MASTNQTITLKRPFAQLNIATSDRDEARKDSQFELYESEVYVDAYSSFDLLTGEVIGDTKRVHFVPTRIPQGETFPINKSVYDYVSMDYILVGESQIVSGVDLTMYDLNGNAIDRSYSQIPLKRNYRTNIYGQLLTSTTNFNISVDSNFTGMYDSYQESENLTVSETKP
jgi:hypothetical protein